MTVLNLQRLGQIDSQITRKLMIAILAVFSVGFAVLLVVSSRGPGGVPQPDSTASTVLDVGIAFASYTVQRPAFRSWRASHERAITSPWLGGVGVALLYTLVWIVALIPVFGLLLLILYIGGASIST